MTMLDDTLKADEEIISSMDVVTSDPEYSGFKEMEMFFHREMEKYNQINQVLEKRVEQSEVRTLR